MKREGERERERERGKRREGAGVTEDRGGSATGHNGREGFSGRERNVRG